MARDAMEGTDEIMRRKREAGVRMRVWQLTDSDWWMAPSLGEAIEAAVKMYGLPVSEVIDDDCGEVSQEGMEELTFADESGKERVTRTYREELERRVATNPVTQHFASS